MSAAHTMIFESQELEKIQYLPSLFLTLGKRKKQEKTLNYTLNYDKLQSLCILTQLCILYNLDSNKQTRPCCSLIYCFFLNKKKNKRVIYYLK